MPARSGISKLLPAFVVAIVAAVIAYNGIRDGSRHYLLRQALVHPKFSAWRRLLNYGDEGSFLDLTGFNFQTFRELVDHIASASERGNHRSVGRPKLLNIDDEIGLYLFYVNSTMKAKHLALIFGILPDNVNSTIRRMMKRVVRALKAHPDAKVQFPDELTMLNFATMVQRREPSVDDVIAFLDGVSIHIQCSDDSNAQAEYYNGYQGDTMIP